MPVSVCVCVCVFSPSMMCASHFFTRVMRRFIESFPTSASFFFFPLYSLFFLSGHQLQPIHSYLLGQELVHSVLASWADCGLAFSNELEWARFPEGSREQGKMEETGCKIICGAPSTLAVKGLTTMVMFPWWLPILCLDVIAYSDFKVDWL